MLGSVHPEDRGGFPVLRVAPGPRPEQGERDPESERERKGQRTGREEERKDQRKKVREEGRGGRGEPLFARVVDQELPPRRGRWWHWRSGGW